MTGLAKAVRLTKRYASFFKGSLTDDELYHWLIIDKPCSPGLLKKSFPQKSNRINKNHSKFNLARRVSSFLSSIPTIKFIAATGSLAINHAKPNDDIDLMIVTSKNTLWLTRLFVVPLIGLFFKRRYPKISNLKSQISNTICMNLWLDESALSVPVSKRNLYTAHEVLQARPLFDRGNTYAKFIHANSWTSKYLANAYKIISQPHRAKTIPSSLVIPDLIGNLFKWIPAFARMTNYLAFRLQYLYMKPKITNETVTLHSAYFHPRSLANDLDKYLNQSR
ncbi:hypothetical protein HYS10_02385 [Candidatus Collierbacteria bacterium]|nr:hypothetical protein [Candidatus Collierbacteria bacterium]